MGPDVMRFLQSRDYSMDVTELRFRGRFACRTGLNARARYKWPSFIWFSKLPASLFDDCAWILLPGACANIIQDCNLRYAIACLGGSKFVWDQNQQIYITIV